MTLAPPNKPRSGLGRTGICGFSSHMAAVQLWYHVGFSHEPAGHSNLSHLLEHLIFEGSSKLAAGQYSRVIARLGGNAQGRCFMAL